MISASGVLWLTADCFLDCPARGAELLGPLMHRNVPDVDLLDPLSPAKSASEYNLTSSLSHESPIYETIFMSSVLLMYDTSRWSSWSQVLSHLVTRPASKETDLSKSYLAMRAA